MKNQTLKEKYGKIDINSLFKEKYGSVDIHSLINYKATLKKKALRLEESFADYIKEFYS